MSDDKVQSALALLRRGLTLGEAASQLGYKKPETLGQLLRRRGFRFDKDKGNYVRANPAAATPDPTAKEDRPDADLIALTTEARQLLQRAAEVLADSLSSPPWPDDRRRARRSGPTLLQAVRRRFVG